MTARSAELCEEVHIDAPVASTALPTFGTPTEHH